MLVLFWNKSRFLIIELNNEYAGKADILAEDE